MTYLLISEHIVSFILIVILLIFILIVILLIFIRKVNKNVFTPNSNFGCLYAKNELQKEDFFKSLSGFYKKDKIFFEEQYKDLKPAEKLEYATWVSTKKDLYLGILSKIMQLDAGNEKW